MLPAQHRQQLTAFQKGQIEGRRHTRRRMRELEPTLGIPRRTITELSISGSMSAVQSRTPHGLAAPRINLRCRLTPHRAENLPHDQRPAFHRNPTQSRSPNQQPIALAPRSHHILGLYSQVTPPIMRILPSLSKPFAPNHRRPIIQEYSLNLKTAWILNT